MRIAFAVLIIFSVISLALVWASLLSGASDDDDEMEEQEKYLKEWREWNWKGKKRQK